MLAVAFIVLLAADKGESNVVTPENQIAVAGRQITLHCSTDSNESHITWKFKKPEEFGEHLIAKGATVSSSFREFLINHTRAGQFSLINRNPQLRDAGMYKCIHSIGSQHPVLRTYTSLLTVLASDPECNVISNSSSYTVHENFLWCQVNYTGDLIPVVQWSRSDGVPVSANVTNISSEAYNCLKTIVNHEFSTDDNGVNVTCKISFSTPSQNISGLNVISAQNTPNYVHSRLFPINITYGVQNLTIVGHLESKNYKPGDRIECWADGNPTPTYDWTELGADNITQGPTLIVDETLQQSQRFIYQCTASNVVAGQKTSTSRKVVVNVVLENQSGSPLAAMLPTVLLTVIGAIIVTSILGYCTYKLIHTNKHRKEREKALKPENGIYEEIDDIATEVVTKDNPAETSAAVMDTVVDNATAELEDEGCYYNLSGVQSRPVPPVYIALENSESLVENDSDEKEEMSDYANDLPVTVK